MRDLTEEELKLAPEGFDEYGFNRTGQVFFFNRKLDCAVIDGIDEVLNLGPSHYAFDECKPIKRKQLDITQHEWSDEKLSFSGGTFDVDLGHCINSDDSVSEVVNLDFNKADAIALAKHFKLTVEDLK